MKINLLPQKEVKKTTFKTLYFVMMVTLVMNTSMVGVLIPQEAAACHHELRIAKQTSDGHLSIIYLNDATQYTVTVTNLQWYAETNVVLTDILPDGVFYVSANPTPTSIVGQQLVWDLGTVEKNEVKTIIVDVIGITVGEWTNTASVVSDDYSAGPVTAKTKVLPKCGDGIVNQDSEICDGTDGVSDNQLCTLECTIENLPYCGDGIVNQDSEICDGTDGVGDNQSCNAQCNLLEYIPEITLVKTIESSVLTTNGSIVYQLNYENTGTIDLTNVIITDNYPQQYVTVTQHEANSDNGDILTWNIGDLFIGASGIITYEVSINNDTPADTDIINIAVVTTDQTEPVQSAATTLIEIKKEVGQPSLTIDKSVNIEIVNPGEVITYTVVITNNGTAIAENVRMADTLPIGLTFVDPKYDNYTWNLGDLNINDSVIISYDVRIGGDIFPGIYNNYAVAKADNIDNVLDTVSVEVKIPVVLGEEIDDVEPIVLGAEDSQLPVTGAKLPVVVYVLGAWLVIVFTFKFLRKMVTEEPVHI
ncbi:MAG: hypothetical protein ACNFW9_02755 [Candidatus Kerfeldbacteria bacterium]